MDVIVPRLSGFCPGVKTAERKLFELKEQFPDEPIYIYGYLINNRNYIEYLKRLNVFTEESIDTIPKNSIVLIRTHGIPVDMEEQLRKEHRVIDLTCMKVKRVQKDIRKYAEKGYFIVVTGKKNHPETRGLISYAAHHIVVEKREELEDFINEGKQILSQLGLTSILVISQTTGDRDLFALTISELEKNWGKEFTVESEDSICPVTDKKELEALRLQKEVEISFVVGDKLSSNAKKLYRILRNGGSEVYFIEDRQELENLHLPLSWYRHALVVSSASTPVFVEKEVCDYLTLIQHSEGNLA